MNRLSTLPNACIIVEGDIATCAALDLRYIAVGFANGTVRIFSALSGAVLRSLSRGPVGVWAVNLVSGDATKADLPELDRLETKQLDQCFASKGWGNKKTLVLTAGVDKIVRVWDVESGTCIHALEGHTSTIRCARVLHGRAVAITGSRDGSLRVWDIQNGEVLSVLSGHENTVRCLDIFENKAVSGSYDHTCRLWDLDTGTCLHVLRGHIQQIFSVAYDGEYIASGSLDMTVRVWNPKTGDLMAVFEDHKALPTHLRLSGTTLITGSSAGLVIAYRLSLAATEATGMETSSATSTKSSEVLTSQRNIIYSIQAHESAVTAIQTDSNHVITGANDGRANVYDLKSGEYLRQLLFHRSSTIWHVVVSKQTFVVVCRRNQKTNVEIWNRKRIDTHGENLQQ